MTNIPKQYRSPIPIDQLRKLHERSDFAAFIRVFGHLGSLVLTSYMFWFCTKNGLWLQACLVLLMHGTIFSFLGFAGASHELLHSTVFRKKWLNVLFLQLFSFLAWSNHAFFARTHRIHHRHTLESDVDTEVPTTKCIALFKVAATSLFDVNRLLRTIRVQWLNARGIIPTGNARLLFPPEDLSALREVTMVARTILGGQFFFAVMFLLTGFWQGIFLFNLAAFIGNGLVNLLASAQHCGMHGDTLDLRESSRTVLLNSIFAFYYWNMNYHIEHHMYPGVPCYRLPRLRKLIEKDLPAATPGIRGILREMYGDRKFRHLVKC
jgi:fatty acid desaturase